MKTTKKTTSSVELTCPYCEETIVEPHSGSMFWAVSELPQQGTPITCNSCGKQSKLPTSK